LRRDAEDLGHAVSLLNEGTAAVFLRTESLLGRDRGADLVVVPRAFRLLGFFTSTRYASWILRPSARMRPLPKSGSSVGISFILAITFGPSSVFAASIAFR